MPDVDGNGAIAPSLVPEVDSNGALATPFLPEEDSNGAVAPSLVPEADGNGADAPSLDLSKILHDFCRPYFFSQIKIKNNKNTALHISMSTLPV